MKTKIASVVAALAFMFVPAASAQDAVGTTDWREQYAYTLGVQAYIFGFPYVYLPSLRADWVTRPKTAMELPLYAPINHFSHVRALADASYRGGGSPNQDTLYSAAWLDVAKEPMILSHPDMGDRYFAFELAGIESDNFAYVGKRTTGGKAGSFAIVGPGWMGELPAGVKAMPPSLTPSVLIFNRYSIGDRTKGLKQDADGGLTLYIQRTSPGKDKESNWLPSTQRGAFFLILRTYMPGVEIVEQKWAPPPVTEVAAR